MLKVFQKAGLRMVRSRHPFRRTVARLERALKAHGMTLFARIDHAEAARRVGLCMPPATVLLAGNPRFGTPLMAAATTLAIDLPAKLLVCELGKSRAVWVVWNSFAYLGRRHQARGLARELRAAETTFAALIHQAIGK